jgi:hypothetical protein
VDGAVGLAENPAMMAGQTLSLRCQPGELRALARRTDWSGDDRVEREIGPRAMARGYLTRDDLVVLCEWKTPRSRRLVAGNEAGFVEAVTRTALATPSERLRIEVLTLLDGVGWPSASVVLHFAHRDRYPILDYRALWTVGAAAPAAYGYPFWAAYTAFCRGLADRHGLTMRDLDRALWQYAKENQPSDG